MTITITTTPEELISKGLWDKYCKLMGYAEYILADGKIDYREEIQISSKELKQMGIKPKELL